MKQSLQKGRLRGTSLREALVFCQALLSQRKSRLIDQSRNRNLDPFLARPVASVQSSDRAIALEAGRTRKLGGGNAFGFSEAGLTVVSWIAQHAPYGGTSPERLAGAGRYPFLDKRPCDGVQTQAFVCIHLKDTTHDFGLFSSDFVISIRKFCLLYVVVSVGSTTEHIDATELSVMALSPTCPLGNVCAVVLSNHSLYL